MYQLSVVISPEAGIMKGRKKFKKSVVNYLTQEGESTPDMEKLVAISDLFEVSLDKLVKGEEPESADPSEQIVKSELYSDIKEHVLTKDNKVKAKKGLKIAGIIAGIIILIDVISFVVYAIMFGLPGQ